MNFSEPDPEKNELHKLLKEYDANRGMAQMVCGRPIELMPKEEEDRIINGFCTPNNIQILRISREKLSRAHALNLDDSEKQKVDEAVNTLGGLLEAFEGYIGQSLDRTSLRNKVRGLLERPIPSDQSELLEALSGSLHFSPSHLSLVFAYALIPAFCLAP